MVSIIPRTPATRYSTTLTPLNTYSAILTPSSKFYITLPPSTKTSFADVNKLAEVLPKEESGKTVDAEYLQFIVITNQSGCDIYDEYQTTMDGINKVGVRRKKGGG